MSRCLIFFALTSAPLAGWSPLVLAHPGHEEESHPDYFFDPADDMVASKVLENELWYDADVCSLARQLWYTWLELTPGKGDQIWVGTRENNAWNRKTLITEEHGEYKNPTLTADSQGRLWLSYEAREKNDWKIMAKPLIEGKPAGDGFRVSYERLANINHAVAADSKAGLWFVWQVDEGGQFDVVANHVLPDGRMEKFTVGNLPAGDWHPRVTVDGAGNIYVAWDAYDGDNFNVYLRIRQDEQWGPIFKAAATPAFEGRVALVSAGKVGAYLAWEEGGENWGKPFRGLLTPLLRDHKGPLHRYRHLKLSKVTSDGRISRFAEPFPMPSVKAAANRKAAKPDAKRLGAFYERPELSVDSENRLWVFYRHYYTPWLGIAHRSHIQEGWGVYARHSTKSGWSKLYRMATGQGDGMQRLELTSHNEGIAAAWTTGRTHRTTSNQPRGLVTAILRGQQPSGTLEIAQTEALHRHKSSKQGRVRSRPKGKVGEKEYELFFGDLHRHTDLSLCRVPVDGTMDDAYRYATEVAGLDFLGITDHTRDISMGNPLSLLWWRCRKEVYRHQLGSPKKRAFVPFYSYERSHGNTADHNVISLRPDMLRPYTYPVPEFWQELDLDTITIPHQPIRRDTWKYQNDKLRPLVEIFQGARDRSIEEDVHRGLAKGYHLGFIASSDHMSTSVSFACVWAENATRESIFQALQSRRTFGATANIQLMVRAGNHWMGEIIKTQRMPELHLEAEGTASITSVKLVLDGKVIETQTPNQQKVEINKQLDLKGSHYVYFHVVQTDGNEAWSSPIWIQVEP